jgi:hypothetical protein
MYVLFKFFAAKKKYSKKAIIIQIWRIDQIFGVSIGAVIGVELQ